MTLIGNNDKISLDLGVGASFNLASKENLTQTLDGYAVFSLAFIDDIVVEDSNKADNIEKTNVTKRGSNYIVIQPSYSFKYKGDERLTVAFNVSANMSWINQTSKQTISSLNTDSAVTSYENSSKKIKNFTSNFMFIPFAKIAIAYDVIPSKLTFNASTSVLLPELVYTWNTSKTTESSVTVVDGNETDKGSSSSKSSTFTVQGYSENCTMNFASGFTYNLSKNLTFDATWNIVGDLFTNTLNSSLTTGNTNIMNNLNKILVHNVSLGITFKM